MKQLYQYLTYNYSDYRSRESIYQKIIDNYHTSLKPDSSVMNELDIARGLDLKKLGICKMPRISLGICEYLKKKYFPEVSGCTESKRSIAPTTLVNDPILIRIFSDKRIIRPIQEYLGIFPSIQFIASWENKGGDQPIRTNEMYWHMDHHGHKFIKVFYYLDDVNLGMGHHQFITKTHNQRRFDDMLINMQPCTNHLREVITMKRKLRGKYKVNDDSIWPIASNIVDVIGEFGTGFAEDTRGLHRGTPLPPHTNRRIIQCLYLPFPNSKDKTLDLNLDSRTIEIIQSENKYNKKEIKKLFSLTATRHSKKTSIFTN